MPLCGHLAVTCPPVTRCCLTTGLGRSVVNNLERSCVYQNLEVYVCMCVYVILSVRVYILLSVLQGRNFDWFDGCSCHEHLSISSLHVGKWCQITKISTTKIVNLATFCWKFNATKMSSLTHCMCVHTSTNTELFSVAKISDQIFLWFGIQLSVICAVFCFWCYVPVQRVHNNYVVWCT